MKRLISILSLLASIILLSACFPMKKGKPIEEFTFTNQNGEPFGLESLKGKVWLADFVFTNCTTVCPPMSANMSELQQEVKKKGLKNVEFVSFTVDPDYDTPEVLSEYYKAFNADFSTWHFLTGYTQEEIEEFAPKNFKSPVKKPQEGDQVLHAVNFYLVNKKGEVIANYPGNEDVPFEQILNDIEATLKE